MCCRLPSDMTHRSLAQITVGQNSMLAVGHPGIFLRKHNAFALFSATLISVVTWECSSLKKTYFQAQF